VGLINAGVFNAGVYSTKRWDMSRLVGRPKDIRVQWKIESPNKLGGRRGSGGQWEPNMLPGFLPKRHSDAFHPSGNSAGYAVQWANIFGAKSVTMLGMTGALVGGYDWGDINPAKRKPWKRDQRRILHFLEYVERTRPGWVRLEPGWDGPFYDILQLREV
jgi:hypothetical protein